MTTDPLLARARLVWETLAATPVSFAPSGGVAVVTSPASQLCPPAWSGLVVLGDAAIATTPTDSAARLLRGALSSVPLDSLPALPMTEVLGPATLAYVSAAGFRPAAGPAEALPADDPAVHRLIASVSREDADESALDEITSPAFVVREGPDVIAAAGYRAWPAETAHVCVLTATPHRGRGLARRAASAAVTHALTANLLPQWRARPLASRRVATALGFRELGTQLSFRLEG
ncbi:GNAT family N-acetyltransferase [Streptomyces lunaelactis]|uniref:GNAT family N-acetyltransferase n=1 Tax=Streptomyces lunaelactis TaxID=1535768 RepID=UPI001584946E|nr:GNAT family N-acetyltransferase [Streptomyces lunaelactis]NUK22697.1 GNAT family N-acetyltransferase [Streptomyces lunaelactis]NUK51581.1 GNAT family N-acetyltransferase [Streptomyces lunaelactis]NUK63896.1 GNAT family N-acetyltransferase [Streptomyces lunaelactis]